MGWSDWHECSFDSNGKIDLRSVKTYAPNQPGIYAIAMKDADTGDYVVQYIGMSTTNIETRLKKHFTGEGNKYIKTRLEQKKDKHRTMERVNALYFMFLETSKEQARGMESLFVRGTVPIGNVQQNLSQSYLPRDLRDSKVEVELDDD
ncbi:MAG: GIY-YIG nuclease family protein [Oscillatoriaceae cyanobacterium Prado104]|jgi:predicted GIY-YIG superfamily endonuclease|nr:GIY-YIG nuclease family protein [Oscillatoriaceae cyanobacterium Prado104]